MLQRKRKTRYRSVHASVVSFTTVALDRIVTTMNLDHDVAAMALDTVAAFVIPFVVLLKPSPVIWRKERLLNFSVCQIVHISNLVLYVP
jgi:hypothetical protein